MLLEARTVKEKKDILSEDLGMFISF